MTHTNLCERQHQRPDQARSREPAASPGRKGQGPLGNSLPRPRSLRAHGSGPGSRAPAGHRRGPRAPVQPGLGDPSGTGLSGEPRRPPRGQPVAGRPLPTPPGMQTLYLHFPSASRHMTELGTAMAEQAVVILERARGGPCSGPQPEHRVQSGHPTAWSNAVTQGDGLPRLAPGVVLGWPWPGGRVPPRRSVGLSGDGTEGALTRTPHPAPDCFPADDG